MEWWILYSILAVVIAALVAGYFILKKRMQKKMEEQKVLVDQHKISTPILVLEKRMAKVKDANIPKNVLAQIPKIYKIRKVPIVKAKIGPQVMDLLCDEDLFDKIPEKKTVQAELAGIFIAGIKPAKGRK
ncbi:MAG: hypothetical protein WDA74_01995 [Spirochaetota bacterium]